MPQEACDRTDRSPHQVYEPWPQGIVAEAHPINSLRLKLRRTNEAFRGHCNTLTKTRSCLTLKPHQLETKKTTKEAAQQSIEVSVLIYRQDSQRYVRWLRIFLSTPQQGRLPTRITVIAWGLPRCLLQPILGFKTSGAEYNTWSHNNWGKRATLTKTKVWWLWWLSVFWTPRQFT